MTCRYCGEDVAADDLLHRLSCDGQQGRVEALEAITTEAVERAYAGSPEAWREDCLQVIQQVALEHHSFTTDRLWDRIDHPHEPRALGGVMRRAVKAGWIAQTDTFEKSIRATAHRNPKRVWRSLIVRSAASA